MGGNNMYYRIDKIQSLGAHRIKGALGKYR